jgi:hypothetical protein
VRKEYDRVFGQISALVRLQDALAREDFASADRMAGQVARSSSGFLFWPCCWPWWSAYWFVARLSGPSVPLKKRQSNCARAI